MPELLTSPSACALPAWKDCSMFDIADDLLVTSQDHFRNDDSV
jgi:hypothetical protein